MTLANTPFVAKKRAKLSSKKAPRRVAAQPLPRQAFAPDKEWFARMSKEKGISQRALAAAVGLDAGAFNRSLKGARRMQIDEAAVLADVLGCTTAEIIERLGFSDATTTIPILGRITGAGVIELEDGLGEALRPSESSPGMRAYIFDTSLSPLAPFDGCIAYIEPHAGVDAEAMGRLSIIESTAHNRPVLGVVTRGSKRGVFKIVVYGHNTTYETSNINSISALLWVRAP